MTAKTMTDEQLAQLARLASQQFQAADEAWKLGMQCFPLNSREYRALCAAGKAAERSYRYLWLLAERRGWTSEQSDEVFTIGFSCTWN